MIKENIKYRIKKTTKNEIYLHLIQCNDEFIPKLDTRVNLEEYSNKIEQFAITFEAWYNEKLVGLIATYLNQENELGFITNVSVVKNYMGVGVASKLLEMCINYMEDRNIKNIKLEVSCSNIPAINFYKKYNFVAIENKEDTLIMNLKIENK